MSLKERLFTELKDSMRNKDQLRKNVITMIRADIKQIEVDKRIEPTEEDIIEIISRHAKQRRDSIKEFEKGGRDDLVEQAKQEISVLMEYLPKQLSKEEIEIIVKEVIADIGASSMKDMGKTMAAVMPKLKGKADGNIINQIVKTNLQ